MTATVTTPTALRAGRALAGATWRATRSPWVWKPAALGTAGVATATVALARVLTLPPQASVRPQWPLRIASLADGTVRVTGPTAAAAGVWGLDYLGGWGEIGPVLEAGRGFAERSFRLLAGQPPAAGGRARLNAHLWPDRETFTEHTGTAGHEITVWGETGALPAWVFPAGDGARWAILVHGRGAPRAQMLRMVPSLVQRGITAMVISYRNDFPTCNDPSGKNHFGNREWHDVEVAVTAAMHRGATSLMLGGMSMGGGMIATFLRRSEFADAVVATILDAPALNYGPILRQVARARHIPGWLIPGVMTTAAVWARIDWAALNYSAGGAMSAPTLLIHGDQDDTVPVAVSDAYAAAEPDLVTYLRVADAGHVASWNKAPEEYEAALRHFLHRIP